MASREGGVQCDIIKQNQAWLPGYFTLFGSRGGILKSRRGIPIFFTNNMIFLFNAVLLL